MSPKRKLIGLGVTWAIAMAVIAPLLWALYWHIPGRLDFGLHHNHYQKVVNEVKARYSLSGDPRGQMVSDGITAHYERSESNQYTITLVTADWGHAGSVGFLYADQPPIRISRDPYQNVDAPGDLWTLGPQVAQRWWVVSCDLH